MTNAQVIETSVTVNNNIPIQDYVHLDDHTQPTVMVNYIPGFNFVYKLQCLQGFLRRQKCTKSFGIKFG